MDTTIKGNQIIRRSDAQVVISQTDASSTEAHVKVTATDDKGKRTILTLDDNFVDNSLDRAHVTV